MPNGKCPKHGGKSLPPGPGHPTYVNGAKSKWRGKVAEDIEALRNDPNLIELRDHIAILDTRLVTLLERAYAGGSGGKEVWADLIAAYDAFERAIGKGAAGLNDLKAALPKLKAAVTAGREDHNLWDEIRRTVDVRRKASEAERRRIVDAGGMLSAEQVEALGMRMVELVARHVDKPTMGRIMDDLVYLVGRPALGVGSGARRP